MEITMTVPPGLAATKTFTDGRDAAGVLARSVAADARDLAGQAAGLANAKAHEIADRGSRRYGKQLKQQAKTLERRAERVARKLPVDTPLDEHRRRRITKRSTTGTLVVIAATGAVVVAYLAWRRKREAPMDEQAPDAFGAAVDKSGNGRAAPAPRTTAV